MTKNLIIIAFCSLLYSCTKGIDITVKNDRSYPVKNIKIYTSEQTNILRFDQIERGEDVTGFLSMSNSRTDGNYIIEFDSENHRLDSGRKREKTEAGYYTNGNPIDKNHIIFIHNDTIIWQSKLKN